MNAVTLRIEDLSDAIPKLSADDAKFARDLIANFNRRHDLSDKQWYWVDKLTLRATNPEAAPQPTVESVGSFAGVVGLFQRAKRNLRYPKISLLAGHQPLQLSLAGENSKYRGQVQVTDGRPYGQNTWFGSVTPEGEWKQSRNATPEVGKFLKAFSLNPARMAQEHGRLTGRCCFCNTALTDERSTAAGFGPVCAKNYGLTEEWKKAASVLETAANDAPAFAEDSRFDNHDGIAA